MKHHYILLKGVCAQEIDQKYGFHEKENIQVQRTHITDLPESKKKSTGNYVLLDEAKKDHNFILSMKNLLDQWVPSKTDIHCFWCRHPFDTVPIGCPIQYVPQRLEKKIPCDHKEDVIIRENVSKYTFKQIQTNLHNSFINNECYFRVDGIFCSFPCCLAFIQEVDNDTLYHQSESLLRLMHKHCFPDSSVKLSPAPSWRLLSNYGGELDICQFRDSFLNTDFINHHQNITHLPMQKMSGFLYESQIKL